MMLSDIVDDVWLIGILNSFHDSFHCLWQIVTLMKQRFELFQRKALYKYVLLLFYKHRVMENCLEKFSELNDYSTQRVKMLYFIFFLTKR